MKFLKKKKKTKTSKLSDLLRVLKELFALYDEIFDNSAFAFQLGEGFFLPLNQFFNVLNAAGSNVTGGAEHNAIQEFNVWLELVTIGITLPVEIDHDLGLHDSGNQLFVLLNQQVEFASLFFPL